MALKQHCDSNNMVDVVQTNFISNMPSVSVEQLQQQEMAKNVKHFGQKHTLHKYANTTTKKNTNICSRQTCGLVVQMLFLCH